MATNTATLKKGAADAKKDKLPPKGQKPPDERFWSRYTRHYEFPISSTGSFVVHGITLLGVLLFAALLARRDNEVQPLPMDAISIAGGGGGNPNGVGNTPGDGVIPTGEEDVPKPKNRVSPKEKPAKDQQLKDPTAKELELPKNTPGREVQAEDPVSSSFANLEKSLKKQLAGQAAGKGQGGPGSGGGKGSGVGAGQGSGVGPGNGNMNIRQKRLDRWTMLFDTWNGDDYLRQLSGLGAILAIPAPEGGDNYDVIRDLSKRPFHPKREDIHQFNQIFWVDSKEQSVRSLASALGLRIPPPYIAAFFPVELEKKLLEIELAYKGLKEEDIDHTTFRIVNRGGRLEPEVKEQREK